MRIFCRGFLQAGLVLKTRSSGRALVAIAVLCLCLFFAVGTPAQQETTEIDSSKPKFTEFEAPGAGTAAKQGTLPISINAKGVVTGTYADKSNVEHGFDRAANGKITTFEAPGAGSYGWLAWLTAKVLPDQGTAGFSINAAGAIAGTYADKSAVYHGYLRTP